MKTGNSFGVNVIAANAGRTLLIGLVAIGMLGCVSNDEYVADLQAGLDEASLSLREAIAVAESDGANGVGIRAALDVSGEAVFSIVCLSSTALNQVSVDPVTGDISQVSQIGSGGADSCAGGISLDEALGIAEATADGVSVAVVPDDDVACAREIQVLSGDTLWEVKVGSDGSVIELEVSDETGTDDDD